jgi:hypothetical protein
MPMEELYFEPRFCGPPGVANGGFACGAIASLLGVPGVGPVGVPGVGTVCGPVCGTAEVTLRRPLPLERPLAVRRDGDALEVASNGTLLAQARRSDDQVELAAPAVSLAEAQAVAGRARYYADPLFPGCFGCGMTRRPGDGLRIFPGRPGSAALWAAPWTPDPSVSGPDGRTRPEVVWAALDCPSGIAAAEASDLPADTAVLLGRMTASLAALPAPGDQCRVVSWPTGRDGRKLLAASALLAPGGEVLAAARAVWITVPRPEGAS